MGRGRHVFISSAIFATKFLVLALHLEAAAFRGPSAQEEAEVFAALRAGDPAAREKLIRHNLRLVAHIVKKYYALPGDQDDLISIGTIPGPSALVPPALVCCRRDVAAMVGMEEWLYQDPESGAFHRSFTPELADKLAVLYGIPVEDILDDYTPVSAPGRRRLPPQIPGGKRLEPSAACRPCKRSARTSIRCWESGQKDHQSEVLLPSGGKPWFRFSIYASHVRYGNFSPVKRKARLQATICGSADGLSLWNHSVSIILIFALSYIILFCGTQALFTFQKAFSAVPKGRFRYALSAKSGIVSGNSTDIYQGSYRYLFYQCLPQAAFRKEFVPYAPSA